MIETTEAKEAQVKKNLNQMTHRHGDVGIMPVAPPARGGRKKLPHLTLADGEVTGHSHRVVSLDGSPADAELYERDGKLYLRCGKPSAVIHQEHARIELPKGTFEIIQQREWSPEGVRRVVD